MQSSILRRPTPSVAALAIAVIALLPGSAAAQRVSTVPGPPTHQLVERPQQPSVVTAKELRRVAASLDEIDATMRSIRSMPIAMEEHRAMIEGMDETLAQLRSLHAHLEGMFEDPVMAQNRPAALAYSRVYHELEGMTKGLQRMASSVLRATGAPQQKTN